jgi:tight adherence protein B
MILFAAALIFVAITATTVVVWNVTERRRALNARLVVTTGTSAADTTLLRATVAPSFLGRLARTMSAGRWLARLATQAGRPDTASDMNLIVLACGTIGFVAALLRTESLLAGLAGAAALGFVPIAFLLHRRQRRLRRFEAQFSEGLDMMTRSLRAGHALGGAIGHVGDHMPDPVGTEFRRIAEEIRLGIDPGEALSELANRVPSEDTRFFCIAVNLQRGTGGNLAEVLDRLSGVIRERFKLLSQARALSAQHKWSAVCVGLSPVVFALLFGLLQPTYFDELWRSRYCYTLLGTGLALEVVGFFTVWRIAQIEV